MCGIVGSIGKDNSNDIVLTGLKRLEYRGYDSCGIAYLDGSEIKIQKSINRIDDLIEHVTAKSILSIGHTRWATHGGVNVENAHPHLSHDGKISLVHNGVIENYKELSEQYCSNIELKSQTDTEIILEVLNHFYKETKDMNLAIVEFIKVVKGSYALIVFNKDYQDQLFAIKNKSPMLLGDADGIYTISSDPSAVIDLTKKFYQIEDKMFLVITKDEAKLYNANNEICELNYEMIDMEFVEMTTAEYDTFMLKEIEEQPKALRNIIDHYKMNGFSDELLATVKNASRIYIVACGTSYHSGLVCKRVIETKLGIPTQVEIASEFGYANPIIEEGAVFIFLSQSGETADSMLVFNQVKATYPIISITNAPGSQMFRNADFSLLLYAGIEVAVASTKAYTCQIAVLLVLIHEVVGDKTVYDALEEVITAQNKVIADQEVFNKIAQEIKDEKQMFTLGRLNDYSLAQEAALKLKEISYINDSAFASGELKHGTISLIEEGTVVISIITDFNISDNSRSNTQEVLARGAKVYTFSTTQTSHEGDAYVVDYTDTHSLMALVAIIPHQYLAYFTTLALGHDVDKPRNLAKSVTVE